MDLLEGRIVPVHSPESALHNMGRLIGPKSSP
jgi:hypothetical protein